MPSLGEAPSGGAKRFLVTFLGVCKKVTRCKSGTISRRYCSNGYVLKTHTQKQFPPHSAATKTVPMTRT